MKRTLLLLLITVGLLSCSTALAVRRAPKKMKAFASERELRRYFRVLAEKEERNRRRPRENFGVATVTVAGSEDREESITNTQHAGVDEGGIVKLHGDHLVMLRRGRLFTVAIGDGALTPVSSIDAFGPDIDPDQNWYDEMLVFGDTVVVIGYSYLSSATEVGLFDIDVQGHLTYRSTYNLRSNDYYSSRNYASRLIGSRLIFYTPLQFDAGDDEDLFESFPAVSKWHNGKGSEFRRIVSASRVYRPEAEFNVEDGVTLHTVTICNLANGGFDCKATSVVGPSGNVFYVSPDSVYVWAASWSAGHKQSPSLVFRLPLDGSGPGALRVTGAPVDQFSFLQSEDQHLNVLVRAESEGDGMWAAEVAEGDVAFMRIPLSSFSDGSQMVPATSYQQLPKPEDPYFHNRFVRDYLLYGTGNGWYPEPARAEKNLFVLEYARGTLYRLDVSHNIDRIEQMGTGAIVVGTDPKDLHFTSIRLNPQPQIVSRYTREAASQGELRSHGFFYKPDGEDSGTLGLPIRKPLQPGSLDLFETSAALLFLRTDAFEFQMLGELEAQSEKAQDDKCRASCIDWYGNARPLFLRGRVFALLGYELVEGRLDQGRMVELRRVNYAPQIAQR